EGIAMSLTNIASNYGNNGEPQKALEYFQKAYNIFKQLGDSKGMEYITNSMVLAREDIDNLENSSQKP
ncbi:MAG: tetratricopeptide repeat protein, partial [Candidatus Hodarchaeota archaeon]